MITNLSASAGGEGGVSELELCESDSFSVLSCSGSVNWSSSNSLVLSNGMSAASLLEGGSLSK